MFKIGHHIFKHEQLDRLYTLISLIIIIPSMFCGWHTIIIVHV